MLGLCLAGNARAQVAVYPTNSTLELGSARQFSAYVPLSPNSVTWSVNDVVGGNSTLGTISATGYYVPPVVAPANNDVVIKATSTAFPAQAGVAQLKITRKYPWLWSAYPAPITVGAYQVSFNGSNFAPDSVALANGTPVQTTFVSSTKLIVNGQAAAAGTIVFSVRQPGPGTVTGNTVNVQVVASSVTVGVSPASASVALGGTRSFSASVSGSANTAVTWSVNGVAGGNATVGTISAGGLYTAPAVAPNPATVTVRATSQASPSAYGESVVTVTTPPVVVSVTPSTVSVQAGSAQSFSSSVSGSANTAVTWSVNGVAGGNATVGTISAGGLYTAPAVVPNPATVTVRATAAANGTSYAQAVVTLTTPPAAAVNLAHARFLEQSSFGPSPATLAEIGQKGIQQFLQDQFNMPATQIPTPPGNSMAALRQWMLYNYSAAPDQLRQRVAYSLGQILVISSNKLVYPDAMLPGMRLLNQHAFGNYRDLLRDMTKSPSMGKYLDLAGSAKPGLSGGANENYPRELLQLFSMGLWMIDQTPANYGGLAQGPDGQPIPTYTQETIQQLSLALTGWVYAGNVYENFTTPMVPNEARHDMGSKTLFGVTLPAGQTTEQDLESVLDILMNHPNTAPFICTRLIRSLVKSNPTPGYVKRVSDVFNNNGQGVKGDLRAVVTAILMDSEARNDTAGVNDGRLKEPMLHICGLLRALGGQFNPGQEYTYLFDYMGQSVLSPPSVFNWFSPLYRIPGSPLFGPEFQIYSPTEATLRGNMIYTLLHETNGYFSIDLTPFQAYGSDMSGLVELVNQRLLHGRMPAGMKQVLMDAAAPGYDAKTRIETVLYLVALSGQHAVQH